MKRLLIACALLAGVTANAAAMVSLTVSSSVQPYDCPRFSTGGVVTVYIFADSQSGATRVAFSLPEPSASSGATYLAYNVSSAFAATGDIRAGIDVSFGSCESQVLVATVLYSLDGTGSCESLFLGAHPTLGLTAWDCNGNPVPVQRGGAVTFNSGSGTCPDNDAPLGPSPPDGATDVPTSTQLGWSPATEPCNSLGTEFPSYYLGTTNPPPIAGWPDDNPHPVGPLQPSTTYYWRVGSWGVLGPVWTFTTTGPNAVKASTWGGIKALYR